MARAKRQGETSRWTCQARDQDEVGSRKDEERDGEKLVDGRVAKARKVPTVALSSVSGDEID